MRTLSSLLAWFLFLTLAVWPAGAQLTPPRQQDGGGTRPERPGPGTTTPPPATSPAPTPPPSSPPPATSPPSSAPPPNYATACGPLGEKHSNGLGQTYVSVYRPGTPGNPATYNSALANCAAAAWPGGSAAKEITCPTPGVRAVSKLRSPNCAVWAFTGPVAGRVTLNAKGYNTCYCPTVND